MNRDSSSTKSRRQLEHDIQVTLTQSRDTLNRYIAEKNLPPTPKQRTWSFPVTIHEFAHIGGYRTTEPCTGNVTLSWITAVGTPQTLQYTPPTLHLSWHISGGAFHSYSVMLTPFSLRTICYGPCGAHASLGLDATQTVDPLQAVIENLIGDALAVPATAMAHVILHDREQQCTLDFVTRHAVGDRQVRLLSLHLRAACHKEKRQEMIAQCISTRTQLQQVYAQTNELVRVIGIRAPMLLAATNGFAPTDRVPTRQPGPPVASKWARLTLDALRSSAAHDEQSSERGSSSSGPAPVQERGTDMHSAHNIAKYDISIPSPIVTATTTNNKSGGSTEFALHLHLVASSSSSGATDSSTDLAYKITITDPRNPDLLLASELITRYRWKTLLASRWTDPSAIGFLADEALGGVPGHLDRFCTWSDVFQLAIEPTDPALKGTQALRAILDGKSGGMAVPRGHDFVLVVLERAKARMVEVLRIGVTYGQPNDYREYLNLLRTQLDQEESKFNRLVSYVRKTKPSLLVHLGTRTSAEPDHVTRYSHKIY